MSEPPSTLKTYTFGDSEPRIGGTYVSIKCQEIGSPEYGSYTWPSALVLAEYMWYLNRPQLQGKAVLELGCGTGLPGLVAASCSASCLLTDDEDALPVLKNARVVLMTNNPVHYYTFSATGDDTNRLQLSFEPIFLSSSKVVPFSWASFSPSFISSFYSQDGSQATWPDLIIAADCFYDNSSSYDSIFATLDFFFAKNPGCKFITTYQVRSSQKSLQWFATKKWGFKARSIPTDGSDNGFCFPQEKYDILQQVQLIEISP